jgi:DNA-binding XRE family transcriptional regulator
MNSATQYLDALSLPIAQSKTIYGDRSAAASPAPVRIFKFEKPVQTSKAAQVHTAFDDFMGQLEADPAHAAGFAEARAWVAETLYGSEPDTIKSLRLKSGLTQVKLAAAMDTSQAQIAKIESGRHDPSMSTCRKLGKVLGVSLDVIGAALERQADLNEQKALK